MSISARKRILFVSENVTLAQVVRLRVLAEALDPARYEVHFACSKFAPLIFDGTAFVQHPLETIDPARVHHAVTRGRRVYEAQDLARYVEADLELLDRVRPDLVVGDLRLSLAVSCPVRQRPYAALINAYWSRSAERTRFPLPDHPIVSLLGVRLASLTFPLAMPLVFAHFARPLNVLRKRFGLAPVGSMVDMLTYGDWLLFPDIPELVPMRELPTHCRFLGAVGWAPSVPLPREWESLPTTRPAVYVTLGSSGKADLLPSVLAGLASLPVDVLVATAGRSELPSVPDNVHVAEYVPGDLAARRAAFVVCNGGASTGYQALCEGKPLLGIPHNLDQYLAMEGVVATGAGVLLRAGQLSVADVRSSAEALLTSTRHTDAAREIQRAFARYDAADLFRRFVDSVS